MGDQLQLSLFDGVTEAEVSVDIDARTGSAWATFRVDGRERWSASVWLDGPSVDGFILRDGASGVELIVRDLAVAATEPFLGAVLAALCRAGGLQCPTTGRAGPQPGT
jgi:hypothetical protein